jgi:hypothetical protein
LWHRLVSGPRNSCAFRARADGGPGIGIWSIDFADEHPAAEVVPVYSPLRIENAELSGGWCRYCSHPATMVAVPLKSIYPVLSLTL